MNDRLEVGTFCTWNGLSFHEVPGLPEGVMIRHKDALYTRDPLRLRVRMQLSAYIADRITEIKRSWGRPSAHLIPPLPSADFSVEDYQDVVLEHGIRRGMLIAGDQEGEYWILGDNGWTYGVVE